MRLRNLFLALLLCTVVGSASYLLYRHRNSVTVTDTETCDRG